MSTGTQIAFEFPENSPPLLISPPEEQIVREGPLEPPPLTLAGVTKLSNLADLLDAIEIYEPQKSRQLGMLASTAAHISRHLNQAPDKIDIGMLADANFLEGFKTYLKEKGGGRRTLSRNSVRSYVNYAQLLLRKAKLLGWSKLPVTVDKDWQRIRAIAKKYNCAIVVRHALRMGLQPNQFTEARLEEMAQMMIKEGRTFQYAVAMQWRFRKCVKEAGLRVDFPGISAPRRKTLYGISLTHFPEPLRTEVSDLLKWKTDTYVDDRPPGSKSLRPASAARLKENLCQSYGFAKNIKGIHPRTLAELFGQECLGEFLKWSETERKVKISTLTQSLWMILPIVRDYPLLKGKDFSWIDNRLAAMRVRAEESSSELEEAAKVDYDVLKRIPVLIRISANSLDNGDKRRKATLIRDQLLMKWPLWLPWRPRNIRECKLGSKKDGGNLFKEEISPHSKIKVSQSLAQAREKDPHLKIWQYDFRRDETKAGRSVHAIVPRPLVPLLEEYLEVYRPILVGDNDPGTLFVNDHGRPFETSVLRHRMKNLTARYAGEIVRPHLFRHIFAFKWLKLHPGDYLTLSKHLWHVNLQTTIRIYASEFDESYAACRVEEGLEDCDEDCKPENLGRKEKATR